MNYGKGKCGGNLIDEMKNIKMNKKYEIIILTHSWSAHDDPWDDNLTDAFHSCNLKSVCSISRDPSTR